MRLETAQSPGTDHASIDDIRKAVADDRGRGEFLVLSSGPQRYIQAAGDAEPFVLEYRDGSEAEHYECTREISRTELESALISYLSGDSAWRTMFDWRKLQARRPWWKLW